MQVIAQGGGPLTRVKKGEQWLQCDLCDEYICPKCLLGDIDLEDNYFCKDCFVSGLRYLIDHLTRVMTESVVVYINSLSKKCQLCIVFHYVNTILRFASHF